VQAAGAGGKLRPERLDVALERLVVGYRLAMRSLEGGHQRGFGRAHGRYTWRVRGLVRQAHARPTVVPLRL
jgi:hypothetical protein